MFVSKPRQDPLVADDPSGGVSVPAVGRSVGVSPTLRMHRQKAGSGVEAEVFFLVLQANTQRHALPVGWESSVPARKALERGLLVQNGATLRPSAEAVEGLDSWPNAELEKLFIQYQEEKAREGRNGPFSQL